MGILDKVRELRESVEEKITDPIHRARKQRRQAVRRQASRDYRERSQVNREKYERRDISPELARKREARYEGQYERERVPIEERIGGGAKKVGGIIVQQVEKQGKTFIKNAPKMLSDAGKGMGKMARAGRGLQSPFMVTRVKGHDPFRGSSVGTNMELYPGAGNPFVQPARARSPAKPKKRKRKRSNEPEFVNLLW